MGEYLSFLVVFDWGFGVLGFGEWRVVDIWLKFWFVVFNGVMDRYLKDDLW